MKKLQRAGRDDWYEMSVEIVSDSENSEDETGEMDENIVKDCGDGSEAGSEDEEWREKLPTKRKKTGMSNTTESAKEREVFSDNHEDQDTESSEEVEEDD